MCLFCFDGETRIPFAHFGVVFLPFLLDIRKEKTSKSKLADHSWGLEGFYNSTRAFEAKRRRMRLRWKSSSHLGCSRNNGSDHSKYFPPNINLPQVSPHLTTPAGIRIQSAKLLGKPPTPIPPKISLTRLSASPRTRGAS